MRVHQFKENGQCVKYYVGTTKEMRSYEKFNIDKVQVVKEIELCCNVKLGTSCEATRGLVGEA